MSWNGTGSLYVICDLPQRADKPSVTSFKRWRWGRGGSVFCLFPAVMVTAGSVCHPMHCPNSHSHTSIPYVIHFHYRTPTVIKCFVWWTDGALCGAATSPRRSCDCVSDLTALIDADWNRLLRSFTTNKIGVESHQSMLPYQGKEQPKEAPLQHLRLQNYPAVEECQINVSPVQQVWHLVVIFWMQVLPLFFILIPFLILILF